VEKATPIESACWRLCACSEALASLGASAASYRISEDVCVVSIVESELKLREVQRQIFFTDVVMRSNNTTLQQAPERFDVVGMDLTAYIFACPMGDDFVRIEVPQIAVSAPFIRRDQANFVGDGLFNKQTQGVSGRVLDHLTDHVALTRDRADHGRLAGMSGTATAILLTILPVPIFLFAADIGFVHFDDAHQLLELRVFHRGSQPMAHVPRRLVCTAPDLALNLECADALFAVQDLPENLEPSFERILGVLENRAADDAEAVVLAGLAKPMERPRFQDINFVAIATRALDDAISPAVIQHELFAGFVGREGFHQFAERHHGS